MPTLPLPTPPKEHHPFASLKKLANSTLPNDIALTAIIETLAEKTNVESVVCLESILMEEGGLDGMYTASHALQEGKNGWWGVEMER